MINRILISIGICAIAFGQAHADSLWSAASKPMTSDSKAHQVGDLVTILIVETSATAQKASTDFNKKLNHTSGAGIGPLLKLLPQFGANSSQAGSASGAATNSMSFTARMSAKVTKVNPNGSLVIEGDRTVQTNGEKQTITLSGTVRPEDIAPDNTLLSTSLADAQIKSMDKGPVGDRQREGLISKFLKLLF